MLAGRQAPAGLTGAPRHAPSYVHRGYMGLAQQARPAHHIRRKGAGPSFGAASAAANGKAPSPVIVKYTVQKGETLWDVAVQHGVSMRTIKDLNKLTGKEPALTEGQQLLVPASGLTTLPAAEGAPSVAPAEALGNTPARGIWVGSEHVRLATVADARALYLRQCERGNGANTLMVLYAPWCPHCRDMEDELERLAEGLSHVPSVRVLAVNGDSPEGRVFAREVLGVAYYPSVVAFPAHSRTFFKYKGRSRDADALLRFLNMTCCAREEAMWALRPAGSRSAGATLLAPGQAVLPFGLAPGPLAAGLGVAALATASLLMLGRAGRAGSAVAGAAASGDAGAAAGAAAEAGVVAELDSSLGKMASLLLRALRTRLALTFGLVRPEAAAAVTGTVSAGAASAAIVASDVAAPGAAAAPATVPSASTSADPSSGPTGPTTSSSSSSSSGGGSGGGSGQQQYTRTEPPSAAAPAAASPAGSAAAAAPPPPPPPLRALTAEERQKLTRLTDDELIALVNSDPDLDKVLSRLLGDK